MLDRHTVSLLGRLAAAAALALASTGCPRTDQSRIASAGSVERLPVGAEGPAGDGVYAYRTYTLANGLRVITLQDRSSPIAAVQLWYHVGSKDERPDRRGFAHMFEHMMFRGTERLGPKAHFQYIRRVGGDTNAYTTFDHTTYVQEVPSSQVEMVLWLEAERMAFLKINQNYFDTERRVVAEEYRLGREQPYGSLPDKVLPRVFAKHPYRWTPIGDMDELARADASELQAFWDTYYVPANAALVVVGDIDHGRIQALAERYFGWIPGYLEPPRVTVREPAQTAPRVIRVKEDNGPAPIVGIGFRTVPAGHPDEQALALLARILGQGESSRLYRDLVAERRLAMFAAGLSYSLEHDGLLAFGAALSPIGGQPDAVAAAIRDHLARVRGGDVTVDELAKARAGALRAAVTDQLTVASKARALGYAAMIEGDVARVNRRFDDIRAVGVQDVVRVANTYMAPEREIELRVEPSVLGFVVSQLERGGKAPDPGESGESGEGGEGGEKVGAGGEKVGAGGGGKPGLARPAFLGAEPPVAPARPGDTAVAAEARTLQSGLEVVVVPNREVPFVTATLALEYGAFADPDDRPGTAAMAAAMLTRGTVRYSYKELADALDRDAIALAGSADMDTASVTASATSDHAARALELLAEVVIRPSFPAAELGPLVGQTKTGLAVAERSPGYAADVQLRRLLFPQHPYARTARGESADLDRLTAPGLAAWWKRHCRPDAAVLYVAGDVTPAQAFALAEQRFGAWTAEGDKPALPAVLTAPAGERASAPDASAARKAGAGKLPIHLVHRAGDQAQIRVGHAGITRRHSMYAGARVLTQVFGGGFDARLNDRLRVALGLTYGARGGFYADRFAGRFTVSTFSKNATVGATIAAILAEIRRLHAEPPTARELTDAVGYLVGSFPRSRETPQAAVADLWLVRSEGLPADWFARYLAQIVDVTSQDVAAAAAALVREDDLVIVVVGDADALTAQLSPIGALHVIR